MAGSSYLDQGARQAGTLLGTAGSSAGAGARQTGHERTGFAIRQNPLPPTARISTSADHPVKSCNELDREHWLTPEGWGLGTLGIEPELEAI